MQNKKITTFVQFKQNFGKKHQSPSQNNDHYEFPRRGSFDMVDAERDMQLLNHFMWKQYQLEKCKLAFIEKWLKNSKPDQHFDEMYNKQRDNWPTFRFGDPWSPPSLVPSL